MLSNYRFIKITLHYFYIVLIYSWFIKLQLNQFDLLLFIWLFIHQVFSLGYQLSYLSCWFLTCFFAFIGSVCIDTETCPWVLLKLSVGHIQTRRTDLIPLQICGRLWRGFRLGVQNFLFQFNALLDIKFPSSS